MFFILQLDYWKKPHLNDHQAYHYDHYHVPIHQFFFDVSVRRLTCIVFELGAIVAGKVSNEDDGRS